MNITTRRQTLQNAFTLIEMMISVMLATILIFTAYVTFRSATKTMGAIEKLSHENRQLRSGYMFALRDADHWHSEANPSFPYCRAHLSEELNADSLYNSRPFKAVEWNKELSKPGNPNWHQAHDPRSWYRGWHMPNLSTNFIQLLRFNEGRQQNFRVSYYSYSMQDFGEEMDEDEIERSLETVVPKKHHREALVKHVEARAVVPKGWNPWHVVGDYARLGNIDMPVSEEAGDPYVNDYLKNDTSFGQIAGARAKTHWHVFQELGNFGCANYLHPGANTLILAPSDNEKVSSYRITNPNVSKPPNGNDQDQKHRVSKHFRKGEIPWMLNSSLNLIWTKNMDIEDGNAVPGPYTYPRTFAGHLNHPSRDPMQVNRQNYYHAMPNQHDIGRRRLMSGAYQAGLNDYIYFQGHAPFKKSPVKQNTWTHGHSSMVMWYPSNPKRLTIDSNRFLWEQFHEDVLRPFGALYPGASEWISRNGDDIIGSARHPINRQPISERIFDKTSFTGRIRNEHTHTTWLQPRQQTDAPNPDLSEITDLKTTVQTSNLRYKSYGSDRTQCWVSIQDPTTNRSQRFQFRVLTTSFRGARQYWGRQSSKNGGFDDGLGNRVVLGDHYK